jgi:hypothetical protein
VPKQLALPPEYQFLVQDRRLTAVQVRELAGLSQRWRILKRRGHLTGGPGENIPAAVGADLDQLYRDLEAFGRKHGFIADPARGLPAEPLEAIRTAIRQQRLVLGLLRDQNAQHQGGIDALWDLWRKRLPDCAPPPIPTVRTWRDAQAALDVAQRELERLKAPQTGRQDAPLNSCAHPDARAQMGRTAKEALAVIQAQKGRGLLAKEILAKLAAKGIKIAAGTFRRHIVPQLKGVGVENNRARGGYYDTTCLPSM